MRFAWFLSVTFLLMVMVGLRAKPAKPPPSRASAAVSEPEPPPGYRLASWQVESRWMPSHADALDDALREAQAVVARYLHDQRPPVEWVPPADFVQTRLLSKDQPWREETQQFPDLGLMYKVQLNVEITSHSRAELFRLGREALAQRRMIWLGKALAGLVAGLAALAGFVRFDDRTKGFCTGWLRLAALGLVAAVGVGLLLVG